jgi:hypothetical protein
VFDNFLSKREFAAVWAFLQSETFTPVHRGQWEKIFTLGQPMIGASYRVYRDRAGSETAAPHPGMLVFINRLRARLAQLAPWIGAPYARYRSFSTQGYLYPVDAGLPWHDDGARVGAFAFYAHPHWGHNWGGELVVSDAANPMRRKRRVDARDDHVNPRLNRDLASAAFATGIATSIHPRPNRLVVIRGRHEHCIKRVERGAGDHLRATISGFFHTAAEDVALEGDDVTA